LAKLVDDAWWEAACASERAAVAADHRKAEAVAEDALWDSVVADGLEAEGNDADPSVGLVNARDGQ
jgi:hypothetical protein